MLLVLDLAFRNVGIVVMDKGQPIKWGTAKTKIPARKQDRVSDVFASECTHLADRLHKILHHYPIKGIIAELPNGSRNARAAKLLGGAVGILASVATCNDLPLEWISEGDSKNNTLGTRKASKKTVMEWAEKQYPSTKFNLCETKFEHVADALMAYNSMKNGLLVRTFG